MINKGPESFFQNHQQKFTKSQPAVINKGLKRFFQKVQNWKYLHPIWYNAETEENHMPTNKKAAFLIYPMFCNYEVALTLAAFERYGKEVVVFAKDKNPVKCEEGLHVLPDKSLDEFIIDQFDCILLSGIGGNPEGVIFDDAYKNFLKQFISREDILIASNSISPTLLARAGLLKGKQFCVGMYEEAKAELDFFEYENQQRAPIVIDGNIITAMGMAFREFAIAITRKLGYECSDSRWGEIKYPINPEDYIFRMNQ